MRGKPRTSTTAELQKFPTLVHSRVGFPLFPAPSEPTFRVLFAHQTNTEASGGNRAGDSGSRPTARPSVGTLRPAARGTQLEHGVAGPPRPWSRGWFCISGIPAPGADGCVPPPAIPALSWAVSGPPLASRSPAEGCDGARLVRGFPNVVPAP